MLTELLEHIKPWWILCYIIIMKIVFREKKKKKRSQTIQHQKTLWLEGAGNASIPCISEVILEFWGV